MAALLLFQSPEDKASGRPPCPPAEAATNSNDREQEFLQPPCRVGSRAATKKNKINSSSVAGQKKQPQRGLGVAQLERLRLLEQKKRLLQEETTTMLAPTRLGPLQTYGYGCNGLLGRHGRGPTFSLLDARHRHAKHLPACSSAQNGRMFNYPVPSSNPGRSICQPAGQLPYSSQVLQRYKRCSASEPMDALQSFVNVPDDAGNCSKYIVGEIIHVEDDGRYRGLASHFYQPHSHLFNAGRKEVMAGLLNGTEACKFQKVAEAGQFAETRPEILSSCVPFLQSVGGSKVGVPLTVDDRSMPELSSFQMFHENSNWLEPKWLVEQKNQWYAVPQRQRYVQNLAASLDLKLSAVESNLVSDHRGDKRRDAESLLPRSSSFTRSGSAASPVFTQKTVKPFAYGTRQDSMSTAYPDYRAQHSNGSRKKPRCSEEEDYIAGSKHGCRSDFLALTLSTSSAAISESQHQSLRETDNSEDTICQIPGCFTDRLPADRIQEQAGGGIIDEKTGPPHTYTFLAAFESKDDDIDECPSLLEISSSNTASASTSATGSSRASTDATSVVYQCHSSRPTLDLSLKLAT